MEKYFIISAPTGEEKWVQEILLTLDAPDDFLEIPIRWYSVNDGTVPRIDIFQDNWRIFVQPELKDVFQWFADNYENAILKIDDIVAMLRANGFTDKTPSTNEQKVLNVIEIIEKTMPHVDALSGDQYVPESIRLDMSDLYRQMCATIARTQRKQK